VDHKGLEDRKDLPAIMDLKVHKDQVEDLLELLAQLEYKVHKDPVVLLALVDKGQQVRKDRVAHSLARYQYLCCLPALLPAPQPCPEH
jgi:hypothetical protein